MSHKRISRVEGMRRTTLTIMLVLATSAYVLINSINCGSALRLEEATASVINPATSDDIWTFILFGAIFGTIAALALIKLQIKLGRR